eukprot:TRINITY_DN109711_c0_g1_i1.p1 TRINITY_DN109711_c0_g1~~TRINITY_DN109711_c0_g1_i1.p1  ORF type:complete len:329 (+),score=52.99 TRINITY_DN109711_c0_g1_i1:26-988(+)
MAAQKSEQEPRFVHTMCGSALSGLISRIVCHPLDTIKSRLQSASGGHYTGIRHCFRSTFAEEGARGLYRGFGIVAWLGTPATCAYLSSYEVFKDKLTPEAGDMAFMGHFSAGMGAEAVACLLFVPVDVIKERLQVQQATVACADSPGHAPGRLASAPPRYAGSLDALRVISRTEGLLGLYKGYFATLASFGPMSALYFTFYEQARVAVAMLAGKPDPKSLPAELTLAASAGAGTAASILTCPLDLAKLRLQTQRRLVPGEAMPVGHLQGMADALQAVWREGGLRALFRGAGARAAFHVPNVCITFTTFEECRKLMQKLIA